MVHVCLDELKSFVLNHSGSLWFHHVLELGNLFAGDAFAVLSGLEGLFKDGLHVLHTLSALSHSQAEIAEPFVVEGDGPVLAEELYDVWNDALFVS